VILPGVLLGRGTVVGANAVVTTTFPDYSILAGVPARIVGSRLQETDSP
jgi:acetyltransferase-like isoleucine patch superfamily enzyme